MRLRHRAGWWWPAGEESAWSSEVVTWRMCSGGEPLSEGRPREPDRWCFVCVCLGGLAVALGRGGLALSGRGGLPVPPSLWSFWSLGSIHARLAWMTSWATLRPTIARNKPFCSSPMPFTATSIHNCRQERPTPRCDTGSLFTAAKALASVPCTHCLSSTVKLCCCGEGAGEGAGTTPSACPRRRGEGVRWGEGVR